MAFNSALLYNYSPSVTLEESDARTLEAAQRAIELDPNNPEAYTAIGRTRANTWNWKEARASFERAFELGPNNVGVLNLYGDFLWQIGEIDRAIALKQRAISLDPLSGVLAGDLAEILNEAGQPEKALAEGERGVRLAPDSLQRANSLIWALVGNNEFDRAWSFIKATEQTMRAQSVLRYFLPRWKAILHYRQGDHEALRKIVDEAVSASQGGSGSGSVLEASYIAFFKFCLDGPEAALPWLERAYREHDQFLDASFVFYLPEQMSQDPAWLAFWNRPGLKELHELRRANRFDSHSLWVPPARTEGSAP